MAINIAEPQTNAAARNGHELAYKKHVEAALERARKSVELPDNAPAPMVEGFILQAALVNSLKAQTVIGQVATDLMWQIYLKGHYHWLGGEYDTLREWADEHVSQYDPDYVDRLILVIERIFTRVYAWDKSGEGLPDPANPERVLTVEDLIARPGLVQKLKESSSWVERADDDKARDIITDVANPKVSATKLREKHGGKSYVLKHQIRYMPAETVPPNVPINRMDDNDDAEELVFVGMYMTPKKYNAFMRLAGEEGVEFEE